jgi:hypothetical protein
MRRLLTALSLLAGLLAMPTAVSAVPGTCSVAISPAEVSLGESFTVTATGFTPNNEGMYIFIGPGQPITFDASGNFSRTEVATKPYTGNLHVYIFDSAADLDASCDAEGQVHVQGDCSMSIEPDRVLVGEEFTIIGNDFNANDGGFGDFSALDALGNIALVSYDADGHFEQTEIAQAWQVGHHTLRLSDSGCQASAEMDILAIPGVPATDALASPEGPRLPVLLLAVLIFGVAFGVMVIRRSER